MGGYCWDQVRGDRRTDRIITFISTTFANLNLSYFQMSVKEAHKHEKSKKATDVHSERYEDNSD